MNFVMNDIKRILFPTDFSDNARNALPYALEIARNTGAELHLLHSIEESYDFGPMAEEIRTSIRNKVSETLQGLTEEIGEKRRFEKLVTRSHLQSGRAMYAISEEAEKLDIDLIVMGTKGRSGLQKILFGSTTADIISHSTIPVLAVPRKAVSSGLERILFATNYENGDLEALEYVIKLAEMFDSEITVLHASGGDALKDEIMLRGFRELVREAFAFQRINFEKSTSVSFFEAVADKVEQNMVSLLVMMQYQKHLSPLKRKRVHIKDMSYYSEVPLLVLPVGDVEKAFTLPQKEQVAEH